MDVGAACIHFLVLLEEQSDGDAQRLCKTYYFP